MIPFNDQPPPDGFPYPNVGDHILFIQRYSPYSWGHEMEQCYIPANTLMTVTEVRPIVLPPAKPNCTIGCCVTGPGIRDGRRCDDISGRPWASVIPWDVVGDPSKCIVHRKGESEWCLTELARNEARLRDLQRKLVEEALAIDGTLADIAAAVRFHSSRQGV